jgi:hypothetical protein
MPRKITFFKKKVVLFVQKIKNGFFFSKFVKKLSKGCQKVVKKVVIKLSKVAKKLSKKLSKSCSKVVKKVSKNGKIEKV